MDCNLSCNYCYIKNSRLDLSSDTAKHIIDFAFKKGEKEHRLDFGFFGGEPLLGFDMIEKVTEMIMQHPEYEKHDVRLTLVTNGTILNDRIISFINKYNVVYQVSFDGHPELQNANRKFSNGRLSSDIVEKNIRTAISSLPVVLVNSVYTPATHVHLPESIQYLYDMGVRNQFFNPDYSAAWTENDIDSLKNTYFTVADKYISFYGEGKPCFINIIDEKVSLILRGGYKAFEKCSMGKGEFAFSPDGTIFPCERLAGNGKQNEHSIGNIYESDLSNVNMCRGSSACRNKECADCGVSDYCMNWCGCSNYFATGDYNKVSGFICSSEKAAITASMKVIEKLESVDSDFFISHLSDSVPIENLINKADASLHIDHQN